MVAFYLMEGYDNTATWILSCHSRYHKKKLILWGHQGIMLSKMMDNKAIIGKSKSY